MLSDVSIQILIIKLNLKPLFLVITILWSSKQSLYKYRCNLNLTNYLTLWFTKLLPTSLLKKK